MAFSVKTKSGSIDAKQLVEDSTVDKNTLDFSAESETGDIKAEQHVSGVKSSKTIVMVITAIGVIVIAVASYYFAGGSVQLPSVVNDVISEVEDNGDFGFEESDDVYDYENDTQHDVTPVEASDTDDVDRSMALVGQGVLGIISVLGIAAYRRFRKKK